MGLFALGIDDHAAWLIFGTVLIIAELLMPGYFLMWVGGAALLTGAATFVLPFGSTIQLILFTVCAIASVYVGRRWFAQHDTPSEDPNLNNRAARMIGTVVTVTDAIEAGSGRVKVGDSVWSARGADGAVGTKMRITGLDGSVVLVEPIT